MSATAVSLSLLIVCQGGGKLAGMFESTTKDFGNVPHGSISVHRFELHNTSDRKIVVSGVRTTCRCATPKAERSEAAPGEDIVVAVTYDTRTFVGERSMSIYVMFSEPRYETVTLRVRGFSRQDVVFNPSQADFGVVDRGRGAVRTVKVEYAGVRDWKIEEVVPTSFADAKVKELYRRPGRIGYEIDVRLEPDAPAGALGAPLQLKTNDPQSPVLRLLVTARIEPRLVASPDSLQLGKLQAGQKTVKRVLLRGKEPFTIKSVGGASDSVEVLCTEGARRVHILQIEYEAKPSGKIDRDLVVHTDLNEQAPLKLHITGAVVP